MADKNNISPIVPLPPTDAKVHTTACDYCVVGCGYKVYTWPLGTSGGTQADENALAMDYPTYEFSGQWISPNAHSQCVVDGQEHHVAVIADSDLSVVNKDGNHSVRGGCLAKKVYAPQGPTSDRLKQPMMRIGGKLQAVSWELAVDVMAEVSQYIIDKFGVNAWGMKTYSYQYFENTYAISKLAFESIKTPAYAPHDKPGPGEDAPGIDDTGINPFSASYDDWGKAEVVFISGSDPYESKTIIFTDWMMQGDKKIIMVLPRKTTGAAWAEKNGGLFLQIIPGTDAILHLAMARLILENGWQDQPFIDDFVASRWEIDSGFGRGTRNTPWQWRTTWGKFGASFEQYKEWLFSQEVAELDRAAEITGIDAELIRKAAEMVAKPIDGKQPKASFALEKGNYWSNNYLNTASYGTLAAICGAGNREGRVVSRLGGHQRGWMGAASYPRIYSPEKGPGRRKKEMDLDLWVEDGKLRFAWVIGTTWCQAMAASQELMRSFKKSTSESPHQIEKAEREHAVEVLKKRVDESGMFVVHQDIYLRGPMGSDFADIVLPAATWGEEDFTRCNGERRLRLYSKFCDAPGDAKPDWWIIAQFAKKMGFKDYDWKDSNDVFEQAARFGRKGVLNYHPLVVYAKQLGKKGHELLRELGTHGIQTPIRYRQTLTEPDDYKEYVGYYDDPNSAGAIIGTKRLHDPEMDYGVPEGPTVHMPWLSAFGSHTGKALLHKTPWDLFSDFYDRIKPGEDELWVTSGRINEIWQTMFDDSRREYIQQRWPEQCIEIHPLDANKYGIESGDEVLVTNDDVLIQESGFIAVNQDDGSFTKLNANGHIRIGRGEMKAVAIVTDAVRPGVLWTNALRPGSPANSLVHRVPDPISNRYRFKLGKGKIKKIGESPYKTDFTQLTFAPRTVIV
ncbi:MAG: arsenate reductase (azurin) large subunit [Pirellulaceae bacterium]